MKIFCSAILIELLIGCGARVADDGRADHGGASDANGGLANIGGAESLGGNGNSLGGTFGSGGDSSAVVPDAAVSACQCAGTMPRSDTSNTDCVCSPTCTIENYCAAAPSSDLAGGCSAGPINGYYILTCAESEFQYGQISSSYFCQHDWAALRAACVSGAIRTYLLEDCGGFNIAYVSNLHMNIGFYYDLNSGTFVGTMSAAGLESLNFFNCAGAQLPAGFANSAVDCKPLDCTTDAGM